MRGLSTKNRILELGDMNPCPELARIPDVDPANSAANTIDLHSKSAPVTKPLKRQRLEKLAVYFSHQDLETIVKVSSARGERPADFVKLAALGMLAELGLIDEERRKFLLLNGPR